MIKIHFTESKVFYDVEVKWKHLESADNYSAGVDTERDLTDRLYNLDSGVVFSPDDFEEVAQINENLMQEIIAKHKEHTEYPSYYHESAIAEMMEEYAKRKNS